MSKKDISRIIGRRYETLDLLRCDIELLTGKDVAIIMESESDRLEEMDFMIDFQFSNDCEIYTIFYLLDNAGRYYITEF